MGFEFIIAEEAQQGRLLIQLLWIASPKSSTYRWVDAVTFPFKKTNRYTYFTAVTLGVVSYEGWKFNSGNYLFTTDTK